MKMLKYQDELVPYEIDAALAIPPELRKEKHKMRVACAGLH